MKVFISHQQADLATATAIARVLERHGITYYLDAADREVATKGENLAAHIRSKMSGCTQLLAVISQATKASQWVPWEVGVATEKDFPLATYAAGVAVIPEFLLRWPYLRSASDLDEYVRASRAADRTRQLNETALGKVAANRQDPTQTFYRTLRTALGQ